MHVAVVARMKIAHAGLGGVVLVLVMTGVAGTLYKVMAPDGWIAAAFNRGTSAGLSAVAALALLGLLAWLSRGWAVRGRNRYAELFVYSFAVAGLLYLAKFWINGVF